jgi:hypothetical protein
MEYVVQVKGGKEKVVVIIVTTKTNPIIEVFESVEALNRMYNGLSMKPFSPDRVLSQKEFWEEIEKLKATDYRISELDFRPVILKLDK